MKRVGIDVGGTFTDVVLIDEDSDRMWSTKVATTPADPSIGAVDGVRKILEISGLSGADVGFVGHGTTIATNMVIEGKGARTALVTTEGFRDILEIRRMARHDRADLYDLFFDNPPPLVPRHLRRGVPERVRYDGSIETPLDEDKLDQEIAALAKENIEAVAVCFINSYVNPDHEKRVVEALNRREAGMFVSASYEVNPEAQEYERSSTTVLNAMLGPRCGRYIGTFADRLLSEGVTAEPHFMQSNGGLTRPTVVAQRPVTLLESGPAGGVTAGAGLCEHFGLPNAILGDMGGTSFDVSLVRDYKPEARNEALINTYTVRCPNIDIVSIGAGGGSIAWIDEAGGVRIGPASAGADPGPACYGRGGEQPTVTDCNLLLGYLDPGHFLGGEFSLDVEAAERAVRSHLADPLGKSTTEAAQTVRAVANALMAQAIRLVTVERGYDPREFVYIPYGGAGPVHAVDLAREMEIPTVIVPPMPGVFSAYGMLVADLLHDLQAPVLANVLEIDAASIARRFEKLESNVVDLLREAGVDPSTVEIRRRADCAYLGQAESLQIVVPSNDFGPDMTTRLAADFEAEHKRHWNFTQSGRPVRLVNIRVQAVAKIGSKHRSSGRGSVTEGCPSPSGESHVYVDGDWTTMPRYSRDELQPGHMISAPAIIDEASSSIVIHGTDQLRVDENESLRVTIGRRS